ncbi:MAG: OmpA family protein [Saprospiraceae bacterium]|nr:OmpA family protein [Saprospiraceae bacterium]
MMTRKNMFNIQDDPNSGIKSKAPLGQSLIKITDENGTKIKDGYSDNNGFFYCEIPIGKNLTILGAKLEYLNATIEIQTNNIRFAEKEFSKTINTELILDKIYTDREINLENIYYDYDKWDIRPEAKPTLDQLAKILNDNPQIEIQLSSHTDCRGEELYNTELSQKRAQAAIDYLIAEGIDSRRLIAKGFGETQPVVACPCDQCTDAQHQTNRRTTFKVLK